MGNTWLSYRFHPKVFQLDILEAWMLVSSFKNSFSTQKRISKFSKISLKKKKNCLGCSSFQDEWTESRPTYKKTFSQQKKTKQKKFLNIAPKRWSYHIINFWKGLGMQPFKWLKWLSYATEFWKLVTIMRKGISPRHLLHVTKASLYLSLVEALEHKK